MPVPEDRLIPFIVDALRSPERRKAILRSFVWAMVTARLPLPEDPRYYIFADLRMDAASYEPDPARFRRGQIDEPRMEQILRQAVDNLRTAGFRVEYPPEANRRPFGEGKLQHPADELFALIADALRYPERRTEILREFAGTVERDGLPLLEDQRYYLFSDLRVYAALYEQAVTGFHGLWIDDEKMQAVLSKAIDDLKAAGFHIDDPP